MISPFEVIYEDNHLLVINKKSGIPSQSDLTGDLAVTDYAKSYLQKKYNKPGNVFCGLIHRLDRPVSGVMVLAKTSKALARMNEIFRSRKINKVYLAIADASPQLPSGKLVHWLVKNVKTNVARVYGREVKHSSRAELEYKLIATLEDKSLIEVQPLTGRGHQIRAQLAAMGCPIRGDVKYGSKVRETPGSICLHAYRLEFEHPVQRKPIVFTAPPPYENAAWKTFASLIEKLSAS
ncbi:MAG: RNA pseudouridine synthase [Cytophagales bacterium]|nr:RNA pseudouridine synthase [Bernardetiaceae bacterium]MDW8210298.1 RNA pseudouridine synthase [Cytophagales bacterium]